MHVTGHVTMRGPPCRYLLGPWRILWLELLAKRNQATKSTTHDCIPQHHRPISDCAKAPLCLRGGHTRRAPSIARRVRPGGSRQATRGQAMHSSFVHGKGDGRTDQTISSVTKSIPTAGPVSGMMFLAIMPCGMWILQSLLQKDSLCHGYIL